jgi:cytosine/adenosine deaminase-related metal-dependent hydrolase
MLTVVDALLIPVADTGPAWLRGWLTVGDDGRITGIGPGEPPVLSGDVVDARGAIVAPGFVSAHSHLFTSGFRGIAPDATLYPWVRAMMEVMAHTGADDVYWATVHGACDFLANGVTSAYNFLQSRVVWLFDGVRNVAAAVNPPEYAVRQCAAAADAGLRVVNAFRLDEEAQSDDETLGVFAELAAASADVVPAAQHLGVSVMGAVQWAASPRTARLEVAAMDAHGVGNQAHFVETAESVAAQRGKFAWYRDAGALRPEFVFGHFVHPTGEMVDTAAAAGCAMAWQATSNGRLGSGVADVVRLRRAGMRVGLGLDDQACTDISDPFANMRTGLYAMRALHHDAAVLRSADVLRMHTLGAAEVLGVADRVGSLEVGKHADLVVVDHRDPTTGPVWDVVATYVLACGLRNLKAVYVGGRPVAREGRCLGPLQARADAELQERIPRAAAAAGRELPPLVP